MVPLGALTDEIAFNKLLVHVPLLFIVVEFKVVHVMVGAVCDDDEEIFGAEILLLAVNIEQEMLVAVKLPVILLQLQFTTLQDEPYKFPYTLTQLIVGIDACNPYTFPWILLVLQVITLQDEPNKFPYTLTQLIVGIDAFNPYTFPWTLLVLQVTTLQLSPYKFPKTFSPVKLRAFTA